MFEPFVYVFVGVWDKILEKHFSEIWVVRQQEDKIIIVNKQQWNGNSGLFKLKNEKGYFCINDSLYIYSLSEIKQFVLEKVIPLSIIPKDVIIKDDLIIFYGDKDNLKKIEFYRITSEIDLEEVASYDFTNWYPENQNLPEKNVLFANNNFLYVRYIDLGIFDINNINDPKLIKRIDVPDYVTSFAYEDNKAYIGNQNNWIGIYDVHSKANPILLYDEQFGEFAYSTKIKNMEVINDHIYFEISNYNYPGFQVCHYEPSRYFVLDGLFEIRKPVVTENGLYGVDKLGRLVFNSNRISTNASKTGASHVDKFELKQNYPNPFNFTTQINYCLHRPGVVDISIYNIRDQKVKTLVADFKSAGKHWVIWDGSDDSGNSIASGLFICKIKQAKKPCTQKMIYLK